MPRDGSGLYSVPPGTKGAPLTTIESAKYNAFLDDMVADANSARPITAGGTGGNSKETARSGLEVPSNAEAVRYNAAQTPNAAEQGQARANIGADVLGGFRNKLINGDFDVWQRGTSLTGTNFYGPDRWKGNSSAAMKMIQGSAGADVPGSPLYYLNIPASAADKLFSQFIENVKTLAGKKATLTFHMRGDVAFNMKGQVYQSFGSGGSPLVPAVTVDIAVTTGWKKFTYVFDVPSVAGKIIGPGNYLAVSLGSGGAIPAGRAIDIAHISLVEGDATAEDDPFSPRQIQQEIALCQRYTRFIGNPDPICTISFPSSGTVGYGVLEYPADMRVPPSLDFLAGSSASLAIMGGGGGDIPLSAISLFKTSTRRTGVQITSSLALAQGTSTWLYVATSPVLFLNAEL